MAFIHISVVPIGTGDTSLSQYVSKIVDMLQEKKDIKYQLTAMGTILEGDIDVIYSCALDMHKELFKHGAQRVTTSIKIDERRDKEETMEYKVQSVMDKLGR